MSPIDDAMTSDDDRLAAYLDGALTEPDRSTLETRLLAEPALLQQLRALYADLSAAMDPANEIDLAEQFLAGETLPFEPAAPEASPAAPSAYDTLSAAVEERKRRYLRFGN